MSCATPPCSANCLQLDFGDESRPNNDGDCQSSTDLHLCSNSYAHCAHQDGHDYSGASSLSSEFFHRDTTERIPDGSPHHSLGLVLPNGRESVPEPQETVKAAQPPSPPRCDLRCAAFPQSIPPVVVPIPLGPGVDMAYVLHVKSQDARGVSIADLSTQSDDGELRVEPQLIRSLVNWADMCICSQLPGPTVRIADMGREWPNAGLYLPGFPVRKTAAHCYVYMDLMEYVLAHFLSWWTCEAQDNNRSDEPASELPLAPGTIRLDQVFVVALRRRHIALDVYEWLPELELRL
ncbi:hypothetical protein L227DRAFT_656895 [Lentinus tigrinus ALCF2SS1-6]|uniref:Uncharacterized protein n=1 Tax=Lentinus tigrinus ALCF2SS1-6 TaxID=1328759 RepID=A0A5C2RWQ3_9APHY|nr:hypothetical protein L227DRAFT_656895 [Lentinus tigrinus ALCF2SS1-6]